MRKKIKGNLERKVSILVPCHNYARFLKDCLTSALTQQGVSIEVIVVDDASTDESASVAAKCAQQDSRVRLLKLSQNLGMIKAVNRGLQEVTGDYFVKLDADDLLTPGSLERSVAFMEAHPAVGFVYGLPRIFIGEGPPSADTILPRSKLRSIVECAAMIGYGKCQVWPGIDWLEHRYRSGGNCIRQPEAVIRCETLRKVGDYNSALPHTSDLEMWLRLATISDVGRINGKDQGYYRIHRNSMQRTVNAGALTDFVGRRDAFLSALPAIKSLHAGTSEFENMLRNALSVQAMHYIRWAFNHAQQNIVCVNELAEFAVAISPGIVSRREWQRIEAEIDKRTDLRSSLTSIAASAMWRVRDEFAYYRWVRTGL